MCQQGNAAAGLRCQGDVLGGRGEGKEEMGGGECAVCWPCHADRVSRPPMSGGREIVGLLGAVMKDCDYATNTGALRKGRSEKW